MKTHIAVAFLLTILCLALSAPAFADLYNNGPTNGTFGAYFVDTDEVTDSFVSRSFGIVPGFNVVLWVPTGASPLTIDWAIGTSPFGNDSGFGGGLIGDAALLCTNGQSFNGGVCGGGLGYDVWEIGLNTSGGLPIDGGTTYWLTLTGATDSLSGRDGWDINSGRSMAFDSLLGEVPSESFTIGSFEVGETPEPSSIMLLGSGVLGILGLLRRKISR